MPWAPTQSTLLEAVYSAQVCGAEAARGFLAEWQAVAPAVDAPRFAAVLAKLQIGARDAANFSDYSAGWWAAVSGRPRNGSAGCR
jgi:alpha-glucuronidase